MANPYKNKVVYGDTTIIDLTDATATADKILSGFTAYGASGEKLTGTASGGNSEMTDMLLKAMFEQQKLWPEDLPVMPLSIPIIDVNGAVSSITYGWNWAGNYDNGYWTERLYDPIEVSFPACTSIGSEAFSGCTALSEVSFPACTTIEGSAFSGCTALSEVSFPACTSIGREAFKGCTALSEASFPLCTSIGRSAFSECTALTTANFEQYSATMGSSTALTFYQSSYLQSLRIGTSSISTRAFSGCTRLTSLTLTSADVAKLGNSNAFTSTPIGGYSAVAGQYGSIYVPASLLSSYQASTNWTYFSSRMVGV